MVHPGSLLLSFLFNALAIQREASRSAQGYYLIAVLFVLFWALILFAYVVRLVFTDDIGKPYQPYDDYGSEETLARRGATQPHEGSRPERRAPHGSSRDSADSDPEPTSLARGIEHTRGIEQDRVAETHSSKIDPDDNPGPGRDLARRSTTA